MRPRLGVNVDHVATVRQARGGVSPDPVSAAVLAELGGADGITVHLREDRRHIQERDVRLLRQTIKARLNLEMAAVPEIMQLAYDLRPDAVCLVPEKRAELTTEGGLNVIENFDVIKKTASFLKDGGIEVSLFIDPDIDQVKAAHRAGADCFEIHTGKYCEAPEGKVRTGELERIVDCAKAGCKMGLKVNAGHGLDYLNVYPVAAIGEIEEFNIGHSIVARAVLVGMERAVREMVEILRYSRGGM